MIKKLFLLMFPLILMSGCEKAGNENNDGGITGWYTNLSEVARVSGFERINRAIDDNELIYTLGSIDRDHSSDRYAYAGLFFFDNGMWYSSNSYHGKCRFLPEKGQQIFALQILNSNTAIVHYANLWDPDRVSSYDVIAGRTDAGRNFGELLYVSQNPRAYTYVLADNKIILTNGDIFTLVDGKLIKDGTSGMMSRYDPSVRF